jgi:O-methyltransferase
MASDSPKFNPGDERIPRRLTLPGFRRYGLERQRLRRQLRDARREVKQLRREQTQNSSTEEWVRQAKSFDYYWMNAHKKIDIREIELFGPLAARVIRDRRTYLGIDRLYSLWQLIETLPADSRAIVEVGAYRGGSARFIAEALRMQGREMPFYVCDTFHGHTAVDEEVDGLHQPGQQFRRVSVEKVKRYLSKCPFANVVEGDIRDTSSRLAHERAIGLVHLDVDVYPITRSCLECFAPRVITGGAILVDDYGTTTCQGVKKAVDEFKRVHSEFHVFHLLSGQAVLLRLQHGGSY